MHATNAPGTLRRDGSGSELLRKLPLQRGQDAVEYAMIVVLVALAITVSLLMVTQSLDQSYNDASACVTGTTVAGGAPTRGSTPPPGGKGGGASQRGAINPCP